MQLRFWAKRLGVVLGVVLGVHLGVVLGVHLGGVC